MLHPIPWTYQKIAVKAVVANHIFQEMYETGNDDFLNFPFYPDLGGTNAEYFLMHKRKDYHKFTVSERDLHPNDKGHKLIGEWFNEQVGRL
tara:strand:- start:68 stop:340 length:273 start_codon:yes stop_codon:yes gene_type:complete